MATTAETTPEVKQESRQSVIAAAVAAAGAEDVKETEKTEKETPKVSSEATKEEKAEVKKEEPASEDAVLAEQGKQLILALRDPEKAGVVIKFLAEQAGYTKADLKAAAGDKKETAEITDDILDILKSEMGEEFDVLSDRIAKALKKILPGQIEKSQADIRRELQEREAEKLKGQSAAAIEKLTKDFFGDEEELPDAVSSEMSKYMDRIQPSPTMTVKELMDDAFHFAVGKLGLVKTDKGKSARTDKNRTDAASRLSASERAPASNNLKQDDSKPLTRQQAIAAAIESASKE